MRDRTSPFGDCEPPNTVGTQELASDIVGPVGTCCACTEQDMLEQDCAFSALLLATRLWLQMDEEFVRSHQATTSRLTPSRRMTGKMACYR